MQNQPDHTEDPLQDEVRVAVFGKQVENFWGSDIGQYLLQRCLGEYNSAIAGIRQCNPTDTATFTKLQSQMIRAEDFKDWLSQAIEDGLRAKNVLEGIDE